MSMQRAMLLLISVITIISLLGFSVILEQQAFATTWRVIDDDTEIEEDYTVHSGDAIIIDEDATLRVKNNITLTVEQGGKIVNNGGFVIREGTAINNGIINNNSDINIHSENTFINEGIINNNSYINIHSENTFINEGIINNNEGAIRMEEFSILENNGDIYNYANIKQGGKIDNRGYIENHGEINNIIEYAKWKDDRLVEGTEYYAGVIINSGKIQNEGKIIITEKDFRNEITGTITNIAGATISLSRGGTFHNAGTISNVFGTIQNAVSVIYNIGTIDNFGGTIKNSEGELNNAKIINNIGTLTVTVGGSLFNSLDATFTNIGTTKIDKNGFSKNQATTFENNGKFINKGTLDNGSVSTNNGIFNNKGSLNNYGAFSNLGILANFCDGVIHGPSQISNNPVKDACILDNTLEIVSESAVNPEYDDGNTLNNPFVKYKDPFSTDPEEPEPTCGPGFELINGICQESACSNAEQGSETISLKSGTTTVTAMVGPSNSAFAEPFTNQSFEDTRNSPPAFIIEAASNWTALIPGSQWISARSNGAIEGPSALYSIPFTISSNQIDSVTLDILFAVDDTLGSDISEGIFVNEVAVPASGGEGFSEVIANSFDITSLANPGTNHLYIYQVDLGGSGAVLFDATINVTPSCPEPSFESTSEPKRLEKIKVFQKPLVLVPIDKPKVLIEELNGLSLGKITSLPNSKIAQISPRVLDGLEAPFLGKISGEQFSKLPLKSTKSLTSSKLGQFTSAVKDFTPQIVQRLDNTAISSLDNTFKQQLPQSTKAVFKYGPISPDIAPQGIGIIPSQVNLFISPLKQIQIGIMPEHVVCNDDLVLMQFNAEKSVCVSEGTSDVLEERGVATVDS